MSYTDNIDIDENMDLRPIEEVEHLLQEEETSTLIERFLSAIHFRYMIYGPGCLLHNSGLPEYLWTYALSTSTYIREHP